MSTATQRHERTQRVVDDIADERVRQFFAHGDQTALPDGTGPNLCLASLPMVAEHLEQWAKDRVEAAAHTTGDGTITFEQILTEEWAEVIATDASSAVGLVYLRAELIQLAAVAAQWVEAIDLRLAEVSR